MAKKKREQSEFWDTVQDIKKLTQPHLFQNRKHFLEKPGKKKQKGLKTPLPILKGQRSKALESTKVEKEYNIEHNIQYRSDLNKDVNLLQSLKQKKNKFQKNQYKFKNMHSKGVGSFKNGMLSLSTKDIKKIKQSK